MREVIQLSEFGYCALMLAGKDVVVGVWGVGYWVGGGCCISVELTHFVSTATNFYLSIKRMHFLSQARPALLRYSAGCAHASFGGSLP